MPRPVTDAEVDFYDKNGWAFLPGLIEPELAAQLLEHAQARMGARGDANELRPVLDQESSMFNTHYRPDLDDELFRGLVTTPQMGANAARLLGRDMAMRSLNNFVAVKLPVGTGRVGAGGTGYHQDHGAMPTRCESLVCWIALTEVTPEMGSMRFYNGSHRMGWLAGDPLSWPRLQEYELSAPLTYKPGDATVHGTMVVHGAGENRTDRSRWSYMVNYFPDMATFTGLHGRHTYGAEDLKPGERFDHPRFPLVYEPAHA